MEVKCDTIRVISEGQLFNGGKATGSGNGYGESLPWLFSSDIKEKLAYGVDINGNRKINISTNDCLNSGNR